MAVHDREEIKLLAAVLCVSPSKVNPVEDHSHQYQVGDAFYKMIKEADLLDEVEFRIIDDERLNDEDDWIRKFGNDVEEIAKNVIAADEEEEIIAMQSKKMKIQDSKGNNYRIYITKDNS